MVKIHCELTIAGEQLDCLNTHFGGKTDDKFLWKQTSCCPERLCSPATHIIRKQSEPKC